MKIRVYQEGIFKSKWLSKFISCLSFSGKKLKAEKLLYLSFFNFKKHFDINGLLLLFESLEHLKPQIGLRLNRLTKSKKKRIEAYPIVLKTSVQYKKAIFWLIKSIQMGKETYFFTKIHTEVLNIVFNKITNSMKKKKEYYTHAILFKSIKKFKWN